MAEEGEPEILEENVIPPVAPPAIEVGGNYAINLINRQRNEIFNAEEFTYELTFNGPQPVLTFLRGIQETMANVVTALHFNDRIQLTIEANDNDLQRPIVLPLMRVIDFDIDRITEELQRTLNSNELFHINQNMVIRIVIVQMPRGEGRRRNMLFDRWLKLKSKSVIKIKNNDNECLQRAIAVGLAYSIHKLYTNSSDKVPPSWLPQTLVNFLWKKDGYLKTHSGKKYQWAIGQYLADTCNVKTCYTRGGQEEIALYQQYLNGMGLDLSIFSKPHCGYIIAHSAEPQPYHIYLYLSNNHYDVVTRVPRFLDAAYFCDYCKKTYSKPQGHRCEFTCKRCLTKSDNIETRCSGDLIYCEECNRYFAGGACFATHTPFLCARRKFCVSCNKLLTTQKEIREHDCDVDKCKHCHENYDTRVTHKCYMRKSAVRKDNENVRRFVIFDTESWLNPIEGPETTYKKHVPCCVVATAVCENCFDQSSTTMCQICNTSRTHTFFGENCINDFCSWLFVHQESFTSELLTLSHNLGGYDILPVLKYLYQVHIIPDCIFRGNKLLNLIIKDLNIRFIDSLNYLQMSLKKMPETLGIQSQNLLKGYFPYIFNTQAASGKIYDSLPPREMFGVDKMNKTELNNFDVWYNDNVNKRFDIDNVCKLYCEQDVNILTQCILHFYKMFRSITIDPVHAPAGIDPFDRCFTIASAANKCYRQIHMQAHSIALYPQNSIQSSRKQSAAAKRWLSYLNNVHGFVPEIEREKRILNKYYVDGYRKTSEGAEHVYEYLGCFFHGHINNHLKSDTLHPFKHVTMGHLYDQTMARLKEIEQGGFIVHFIWECVFERQIKTDPQTIEIMKKINIHEPIELHAALKGGRTNALKLYWEVENNDKMLFYDVKSLYPFVMKCREYPLHHPEIITDNIGLLETVHLRYKGLFACTVLAPQKLYLPLLHYTARGKLLFPLCKTCADIGNNAPCIHRDSKEREFYGIYTHNELKKAVDLGYKITAVFEIYAWKDWSTTMFSSYIKTFFTIKEQASGYPEDVKTEEQKRTYIKNKFDEENILLDDSKMIRNNGLRSLSKLILNSLWGKFCQRNNLEKHEYFTDPSTFFKLIDNDIVQIKDLHWISEDMVFTRYMYNDMYAGSAQSSNASIGVFTTAYARLLLYEYMEKIGPKNVCYFDTDSILFTSSPESEKNHTKLLGTAIGCLTSELQKDDHITHFVSGGPKHYIFKTKNNKSKVVIKGIKVCNSNNGTINFETLKNIVMNDITKTHTVIEPDFFARNVKTGEVKSFDREKLYRVVYTKRRLVTSKYGVMTDTVPFGWLDEWGNPNIK